MALIISPVWSGCQPCWMSRQWPAWSGTVACWAWCDATRSCPCGTVKQCTGSPCACSDACQCGSLPWNMGQHDYDPVSLVVFVPPAELRNTQEASETLCETFFLYLHKCMCPRPFRQLHGNFGVCVCVCVCVCFVCVFVQMYVCIHEFQSGGWTGR